MFDIDFILKIITPLLSTTGLLAIMARWWAKRADRHYSDAVELRRVQDERIEDLSARLTRAEEANARCEEKYDAAAMEARERGYRISELERSNDVMTARVNDLMRLIDRRHLGD